MHPEEWLAEGGGGGGGSGVALRRVLESRAMLSMQVV